MYTVTDDQRHREHTGRDNSVCTWTALLWNEGTHSLSSVLDFGPSLYSAGLPVNKVHINSNVHTKSEYFFNWHILEHI